MERYYGYAVAVAYRVLYDRDEAHDAAVRLFERLSRKAIPQYALRWVRKSAQNIAIERRRDLRYRSKLTGRVRGERPLFIEELDGFDPEAYEYEEPDFTELGRAIKTLPDAERAALELRCILGLSRRDTQRRLGMRSPYAVDHAVRRAKYRMREVMA
jgi:RNA polymerase sigma factor (sigma-70 family)